MEDELEYPFHGKGVFVVLKLCEHYFCEPWDKLPELDYETDRKNFLQAFNLTNNSSNLLYDENLTNESGEKSFDRFMDTFKDQLVEKDAENKEPSFVMFVLMSHGLPNGGILLSTPESAKERVQPCDCDPNNHSATGRCYVRYISKHIMEKVSAAYRHLGIPKIFLIQTCRGNERSVVKLNETGARVPRPAGIGIAPSESELFILNTSDCFLFRPCVESQGSWAGTVGTRRGSFFIKGFCNAIKELRNSANQSAANRQKLSAVRVSEQCPHPFEHLLNLVNEETMDGGWLVNVCQRTTSLVTRWFFKDIPYSPTDVPEHDKQQPHFSSSLAYKVSCLKMLKTQWGVKDQYLAEWYRQRFGEEKPAPPTLSF